MVLVAIPGHILAGAVELTAEALADKPAEGLVATIIGGRPGTPMPPFSTIVTELEAQWIVDQLLRGFPPDAGLPQARSAN